MASAFFIPFRIAWHPCSHDALGSESCDRIDWHQGSSKYILACRNVHIVYTLTEVAG